MDERLSVSVLKMIGGNKGVLGVLLFLLAFLLLLGQLVLPSLGDWILQDKARVTSLPKRMHIFGWPTRRHEVTSKEGSGVSVFRIVMAYGGRVTMQDKNRLKSSTLVTLVCGYFKCKSVTYHQ